MKITSGRCEKDIANCRSFQRNAALDLARISEPVTISIPAIAAAVSASSSAIFFSDPSWLKRLRGSKKAALANPCRMRSTEMFSFLVRSSASLARSALTLTFLNKLEGAAAAVLRCNPPRNRCPRTIEIEQIFPNEDCLAVRRPVLNLLSRTH